MVDRAIQRVICRAKLDMPRSTDSSADRCLILGKAVSKDYIRHLVGTCTAEMVH